ncbi:MAG: hypothetical protein QNI87_01735 [Erythrobacter sp.]|uniref:hypothetical protein n=1 Tax=Erythrobacter sp. TaxID=1042 RepID=UPI0026250205|nr:hypothetical protein [Erythrobacter sp.]MDJ0977236.1 hypothetical protein [Erythrobacter sp.]
MRYHQWYKALLRLYPKGFRDRFGESMAQTFADLDRERRDAGRSPAAFLAWMFLETLASVALENVAMLNVTVRRLRKAALASGVLLALPLTLTLANPAARLRGGEGGGFDWMPGSFVVMGVMLFAAALGVQIAAERIHGPTARAIAVLGVIAFFALIWVELAVDGISQLALLMASSPSAHLPSSLGLEFA